MKALNRIVLESRNPSEREHASRLLKLLQTFEFVFLLVIMSRVLSAINTASTYLQLKEADLKKATDCLRTAYNVITSYRDGYAASKKDAVRICHLWGVEPKFQDKRLIRRKRHFDELSEDTRLTDVEMRFRVTVYNPIIDTVDSQLQNRFVAMNDITQKFSKLFPQLLSTTEEGDIVSAARVLQADYSSDLSDAFDIQLVSFATSLKSEISKLFSVQELAHLLIVDYCAMASSFPDVVTSLLLFLTLPVTVASAERSFSKLRLIKNYLRGKMGQERLSLLCYPILGC